MNIRKSKDIGYVAKLEYHKINAEIAFLFEEYDLARSHCKVFLDTTVELLGNHPYTVKAYRLMGDVNKATAQLSNEDDDTSLLASRKISTSLKIEADRYGVFINENEVKIGANVDISCA